MQCPGCGEQKTVSVDDTVYGVFSNNPCIEDDILEGTANFHCWNCMRLVEADTRIALVESYSKADRTYNGLQESVEDAADFYREKGSHGTVDTLLNEFELPENQGPVEERQELIKERVAEAGI